MRRRTKYDCLAGLGLAAALIPASVLALVSAASAAVPAIALLVMVHRRPGMEPQPVQRSLWISSAIAGVVASIATVAYWESGAAERHGFENLELFGLGLAVGVGVSLGIAGMNRGPAHRWALLPLTSSLAGLGAIFVAVAALMGRGAP